MIEATQGVNIRTRLRMVVRLASHFAVIGGVLVSVVKLIEFVDTSKHTAHSTKLSALQEIKTYLAQDEELRRRGQRFLINSLPAILPKLKENVTAAGSGEAFYLSKELEDYSAVHYHYEQMGALVKLEYVDFQLIFEVIAFPDAYMEAVEPIRAEVAAHWKGPGKPLPDFGANIGFLKRCYDLSRRESTKPARCPKA